MATSSRQQPFLYVIDEDFVLPDRGDEQEGPASAVETDPSENPLLDTPEAARASPGAAVGLKGCPEMLGWVRTRRSILLSAAASGPAMLPTCSSLDP